MKADRTYVTVTDPHQVVLANLPFKAGQRVEILVLAAEPERDQALQEFDAAFKTTQALPQTAMLTHDEIAAEIQAWRREQ